MKKNVGNADRWIRIILGIAIVAAGLYFKSWWGLIGVVLLGTALVRTCPLFMIFGISSRKNP